MPKTRIDLTEEIKTILINHNRGTLEISEDRENGIVVINISESTPQRTNPEFKKINEIIIGGLKTAKKHYQRASLAVLLNRRSALKNFDEKTIDNALNELEKNNKIKKTITESGKIYYSLV